MVMSFRRIRPRPSRPSRRSPDGGRTGPAPRAQRRAGAQRRTAGGGYSCFAMQSRRLRRRGGRNSRAPAIAGPGRFRPIAALEGRGRGPLRRSKGHRRPARRRGSAPRHPVTAVHRGHEARRRPRGASCRRKAARSASRPRRRRSSLKSPSCGDRASASMPAARGAVGQTSPSRRRRPGRCRGRHRGGAAPAGRLRAARWLAERAATIGRAAGRCAATASSRAFAGGEDVGRPRRSGRRCRADGPAPGAGRRPAPCRGRDGSSQVRWMPVIVPSRSVTAASRAGQVSRRCRRRRAVEAAGWKRRRAACRAGR